MNVPAQLVYPLPDFANEHRAAIRLGLAELRWSSVAFVGLARNCAGSLAGNLQRLEQLAALCGAWCLHVETNDNADDTAAVLEHFAATHEQASFRNQTLNRAHYGAEFAGRRTIALAEYRTACQEWVAEHAADCEYTVLVDWDAWGGWFHEGALTGFGYMASMPEAFGMASVSLMQHDFGDGSPQWAHYDAWALRLNCYADAYTLGCGGWVHNWLPFVGSPPVRVCSAFGGMTIYRTRDYLAGVYDGRYDCEHTSFHRTIAERTGRGLFINPSQRTIMRWVEEQADHARQHSND